MLKDTNIIDEYILDYLAGEANKAEIQELEAWLAETGEEGKAHFKAMARHFYAVRWSGMREEDEKHILQLCGLSVKRVKRSLLLRRWAVAAGIALLTAAGTAGWFLHEREATPLYATQEAPQLIDHTRPMLRIGDEKPIVLPENMQTLLSSERGSIQVMDSSVLAYHALATNGTGNSEFHILEVPKGCEYQLQLSDGSKVWLNAESRLRYPAVFPVGKREVYLEGEGYFEVAKLENAPFIVHTEDMELEVLGTSFNIRSYKDERTTVTTLFTGRIGQFFPEAGTSLELSPAQRSVFSRQKKSVRTEKADVREALAWKEGKIVARNERLEDIFVMLSRWYNFKVCYTRPELKDMRFHLHTNRYKSIREVLDNLTATKGIQVDYFGDTIYIR